MNQKIHFIKQHPFHLALESGDVDPGFVTEKVFQVWELSCCGRAHYPLEPACRHCAYILGPA